MCPQAIVSETLQNTNAQLFLLLSSLIPVRWCTGDLSGRLRGEVDGVVVKTTREEAKEEGEKGQVAVAVIL